MITEKGYLVQDNDEAVAKILDDSFARIFTIEYKPCSGSNFIDKRGEPSSAN